MSTASAEIDERYGWLPRRLNPAVTYLEEQDVIHVSKAIGSGPYVTAWVAQTNATRRFVKSHSDISSFSKYKYQDKVDATFYIDEIDVEGSLFVPIS